MNININAVKFRMADKLEDFIIDKVSKLDKLVPDNLGAEVTLKVDKPESENNKVVNLKLLVRGYNLFASKQGDSFEKCTQDCIDALKAQIDKHRKDK